MYVYMQKEVIVLSDPRLISPMLDGFALGGSISCHSGVNCYPAMRNDSDERYIVKTISIPASQVQLEALLLTGAYPDEEAAKGYFKELARGIRDEVEILDRLSAQRGFLPYTKYQIAPMEEGVGYEVFLLSPYKRSLSQQFKSKPLTHLAAVNMGIDLCAALSVCREAGFLYVDLKPGNIFLDENQEYHIGDLGFVALNSLKYASLPDRYRSDYVPPEVSDAYATLNTTMDTYALGLILYQVFNNGQLPFSSEEERKALMDQLANGVSLPPPAYADYEMAEIILKACAFNPDDRWSSPLEMGHALIAYMQRNAVNDVPIVPPVVDPPVVELPDTDEPEDEETETESEDMSPEDISDEEEMPDEPDLTEADAESDEEHLDTEASEESDEESSDTEVSEESDESDSEESDSEEPEKGDWIDRMSTILSEDESADSEAPNPDEPSLRELLQTDDDEAPEIDEEKLTGEAAEILNQAQELIDHEAPEPAVAPEPIDIPIPAPIVLKDEEDDEDNADAPSEESDSEQSDSGETADETPAEKPKKIKKIIASILIVIALAAAAYGGYYVYTNYYLVPIDTFSVEGHDDVLVVTIGTTRDNDILTVVCKDNFGNVLKSKVENGQATFNALTPGSQYLIDLEVEKNHKLTGEISQRTYSTPPRTQVVSLAATAGPEDGSAVVSFGVEGPESESWTLHYSTEGEEEKTYAFSGHTATVTGLTLGKTYTFSLTASDDVFLIGENSIEFFSGELIFAEGVKVFSAEDGTMTAAWSAPKDTKVESWTVHCYNADGYDQTQEVTEPKAVFTGTSAAASYTLEIVAKGMSEAKVTEITGTPVTVTTTNVQSSGTSISVSWEFQGIAPANGWVVSYTADKNDQPQTVTTDTTSVTIYPVAPNAHYDISIQTVDNTSVFGGTGSADTEAITEEFSGYRLTASDFTVTMHHGPEAEDWSRGDLGESTTTFAPGSKMALRYYTSSIYNLSGEDLVSMFVIRNADGNVVSTTTHTRTWDDMMEGGYCLEEIQPLPSAAGNYSLEIYIGNAKLTQLSFVIQ